MRREAYLVMGLGALAVGCSTLNCNAAGCLGQSVSLELVDAAGEPAVGARGQVAYRHHQDQAFDCSVKPTAQLNDIDCEDGVLTLDPVYNDDDTIEVRFEREDGSFTEWQPVELAIEERVLRDFNGPDCDCTVRDGTTKPVTVPADAG